VIPITPYPTLGPFFWTWSQMSNASWKLWSSFCDHLTATFLADTETLSCCVWWMRSGADKKRPVAFNYADIWCAEHSLKVAPVYTSVQWAFSLKGAQQYPWLFYHPRMRLGNAFGCIRLCLSCSGSNVWMRWSRNFILVRLHSFKVKVEYQGHRSRSDEHN